MPRSRVSFATAYICATLPPKPLRTRNQRYRNDARLKRDQKETGTHCRKMTVELCLPMPNTSVTLSRLTVCAAFALVTASFRRVWNQIRTISEAVATMAHLSAGAGAVLAMTACVGEQAGCVGLVRRRESAAFQVAPS